MYNKQYLLKEIASEDELELFLRLRYDGFTRSAASLFITKNSKALDVDYYDRKSQHYGIYIKHQTGKTPVGYFRIVLEDCTNADSWVQNIAARAGLTEIIERRPSSMFPCLGIYPSTSLEQEFFTKKVATEKAGEVSRFVIVKTERSLKLSLQIIRSAFAIGLLHIQHAFVGCFHDHSRAYMNFGFRQCPGSSKIAFDSTLRQKEGIILYCRTQYITHDLKSLLTKLQDQFLTEHCLTFNI